MGFFDFLNTKNKSAQKCDLAEPVKRDELRAYAIDDPFRAKIVFLNSQEKMMCKKIFDYCFKSKLVLCEMEETELRLETEKLHKKIRQSDSCILIKKFVEKFGDQCVSFFDSTPRYEFKLNSAVVFIDDDEFKKQGFAIKERQKNRQQFIDSFIQMKALLRTKGFDFTDSELVPLMWFELMEQKCELFDRKASHSSAPLGVQSYLDAFAEISDKDLKEMVNIASGVPNNNLYKKKGKSLASSFEEYEEVKFASLPAWLDLSDIKELKIGCLDMKVFFEHAIIGLCNKVMILKRCIEAKGLAFETPNQSPIKIDWLIETSLKKVTETELKKYEESLINHDTDLLQKIELMDGYEFEKFLKELFTRMGYEVMHTQLSGDQGADLVVVKHGQKTVVQAKRFSGSVGNGAVQEAVGAIKFYKADKAMVVTNSEFTASARKLALANGVELINGANLANWIDGNY